MDNFKNCHVVYFVYYIYLNLGWECFPNLLYEELGFTL